MAKTVYVCRSCKVNGFRSEKFAPVQGALPVCPKCDRVRCRRCMEPILDGSALKCGHCEMPIGSIK
jgi:hypothetical protein